MLRGLIFATCMAAGATAAYAYAQKDGGPPICPDRLAAGTDALTCFCPSEATATGAVWGDGVYTDDSAICRAALHAGAIGTRGGMVDVFEAPGQPSYPAMTRNGVASGAWTTAWGRSIVFQNGEQPRHDMSAPFPGPCPANATQLSIGTGMTCACSVNASASGPVWGSGPYTADSSLCRAALHAGAIGDVGEIRFRVGPGRDSYPASRRNGVDSSAWGAYTSSIEFDR